MAIYETRKEKENIPRNTDIWAYAFTPNENMDGMALKQVPVKGQIGHDSFGDFFAPLKKSGNGLALSKAIQIGARCYADTEEEAIAGYNAKIQAIIDWHGEHIKNLEGEKL